MRTNGMRIEHNDIIYFVVSCITDFYLVLYLILALVLALCVLILLRTLVSRLICLNAARVLHNK